MALSASVLGPLIKAKVLAVPALGWHDGPALDAMCLAFAEAFIEHVTAAGVVSVTITAQPTACPAGAGTCTGVATGVIS